MNSSYSITSKFQVTIPKDIRDELKLTENDRLAFNRHGHDIVISKVPTLRELADELQADLKHRGWNKKVTQADIDNARDAFYKQGGKW